MAQIGSKIKQKNVWQNLLRTNIYLVSNRSELRMLSARLRACGAQKRSAFWKLCFSCATPRPARIYPVQRKSRTKLEKTICNCSGVIQTQTVTPHKRKHENQNAQNAWWLWTTGERKDTLLYSNKDDFPPLQIRITEEALCHQCRIQSFQSRGTQRKRLRQVLIFLTVRVQKQ